jgi:hypothetical protein
LGTPKVGLYSVVQKAIIQKNIGELNITRGSAKEGIIQMVSSNASFSPRDIMEAADTAQTLFFQLYKHNDEIAEKLVCEVEELGYKAIFLTVDALVVGNRERDIRCPWILEDEENGGPTEFYVEGIAPSKEVDMLGTAGALISKIDRDMTWDKVGPPCARRDFVSDFFHIRPFLGYERYPNFPSLSKVRLWIAIPDWSNCCGTVQAYNV